MDNKVPKEKKADTHSSQDEALEAPGNLIKAQILISAQHGTDLGNRGRGRRAKNPLSASDRLWCYSYNPPKEYTAIISCGIKTKSWRTAFLRTEILGLSRQLEDHHLWENLSEPLT